MRWWEIQKAVKFPLNAEDYQIGMWDVKLEKGSVHRSAEKLLSTSDYLLDLVVGSSIGQIDNASVCSMKMGSTTTKPLGHKRHRMIPDIHLFAREKEQRIR